MQPCRKFARVNTLELKSQLFKKIGRQRAEKYFYSLEKFLRFQLTKEEFHKICMITVGEENIKLHNVFIRSILGNACLSMGPPGKQTATGNSGSSVVLSGPLGEGILPSPRRARSITSRDRKFADRPSPLGPLGKGPYSHAAEVSNSCDVPRSREQRSTVEIVSIGSKALLEVVSVEDGEEVEQVRSSPVCVQSRTPILAPLGIPKPQSSQPSTSYAAGTCYTDGELPDTLSLWKLLEHKLEAQGLKISMECANALNYGLNAHLNQLLKSCLGMAKSRQSGSTVHRANGRTAAAGMIGGCNHSVALQSGNFYQASLQDLQVAVESNPQLLGCDFAAQREKIAFRLSDK